MAFQDCVVELYVPALYPEGVDDGLIRLDVQCPRCFCIPHPPQGIHHGKPDLFVVRCYCGARYVAQFWTTVGRGLSGWMFGGPVRPVVRTEEST